MRNIRRDRKVAVLIDSPEQPCKSVQYNGEVTIGSEPASAEEICRLFERSLGGRDAANEYGRGLVVGGRRLNRFLPGRHRSIDFGKLES